MEKISVIVPCYNEEKAIPYFYKEIKSVIEDMSIYSFEIILIDDGSSDKTVQIMRELSELDNCIHYISFSRNFGKEAAIFAGFSYASGEYVVMMDADLQDPPNLLPQMMEYIQAGYDSVATRRVTRKGEPRIRSFFARCFYRVMNRISKTELVDGARDYRLMTRQFVESLLEMQEYNRFSKGMFGWIGYKTKWLEYENKKRVAGETKWSFWKLFLYSIDGIVAFSTVPLAIAGIFGLICCILAFLFIIIVIAKTLILGEPVAGWPSTICIILLIGGIQLLGIGVLGIYLTKTYMEVKNRPIFICKETDIVIQNKKD